MDSFSALFLVISFQKIGTSAIQSRATAGVSKLWTYQHPAPDQADDSRHRFYDATTVFPDHVVGRITAIGALAALIHRDRTGTGARVHVSQAEAVVNQLDARYVSASGANGD